MAYDRRAILDQLAAAIEAVDEVAARARTADALDDVVSHPGLRYAPLSADQTVYVVACDGTPIGHLWRGPDGHVLGGWTCAPFGAQRLGPYPTGRAAAAGLARACGVLPHTPSPR